VSTATEPLSKPAETTPQVNVTCALCGSSADPAFIGGEHRMFRCRACRTAFVSPQPSAEYLDQFYSRFHQNLSAGGGYEQIEPRMQADFPAKTTLVRRVAQGLSAAPRILDVGCGKGYFVRACIDAGLDARGVDLSDTAIRYARDTLKVPAECGRVEDLPESSGAFDVVTFWATIEHVPDPVATLSAIRRVLRPGGHLLLDTGLGDDWLDRLLPGVTQWYDPPQHLWVFSEPGMRVALRAAGLEAVSIDRSFERSRVRRCVRALRAGAAALGLRAVSEITRLRAAAPFEFRRYPIGNLMSVVAKVSPAITP
jgi:SAM-dependent methyltransferase